MARKISIVVNDTKVDEESELSLQYAALLDLGWMYSRAYSSRFHAAHTHLFDLAQLLFKDRIAGELDFNPCGGIVFDDGSIYWDHNDVDTHVGGYAYDSLESFLDNMDPRAEGLNAEIVAEVKRLLGKDEGVAAKD